MFLWCRGGEAGAGGGGAWYRGRRGKGGQQTLSKRGERAGASWRHALSEGVNRPPLLHVLPRPMEDTSADLSNPGASGDGPRQRCQHTIRLLQKHCELHRHRGTPPSTQSKQHPTLAYCRKDREGYTQERSPVPESASWRPLNVKRNNPTTMKHHTTIQIYILTTSKEFKSLSILNIKTAQSDMGNEKTDKWKQKHFLPQ